MDEVCYILNKYQQYQYFNTKDFMSRLHFEISLALSIAKIVLKHPLFITFSLFLTVNEVCNISNKYWLSNKSAIKIFLHKTPDTAPWFQQKICVVQCRNFWKHPLFNTFLLFFTVDEVCNISNKYAPPSKKPKL